MKPKRQILTAEWLERRKEEKRQEYRRRGEPVPRWLLPDEPSKPVQLRLFEEPSRVLLEPYF